MMSRGRKIGKRNEVHDVSIGKYTWAPDRTQHGEKRLAIAHQRACAQAVYHQKVTFGTLGKKNVVHLASFCMGHEDFRKRTITSHSLTTCTLHTRTW